MNAQFASYVTSKAFAFSMTQTQAEALASIRNHCRCYDSYGAIGSLLRKGLIELIGCIRGAPATYYRVTRAGDLMYQLMAEAGLVGYAPAPRGWEIPEVIAKYRHYWTELPTRESAREAA